MNEYTLISKCPACGSRKVYQEHDLKTGNVIFECDDCGTKYSVFGGDIKIIKNDQTAKADAGKVQLTLVPRKIFWDIAEIRMYGNKKYGDPENWRTVEVSRYRDAAFRHFLLYLDDPHGVDEESGLPHLWHLACNIAFLCEMEDLKIDE